MTEFSIGNIQGYHEETENGLHVHFYGSNEPADWVANFSAWKEFGTDRHAGFLASAKLAAKGLLGILAVDRPIWLTGHSYGGCIAVGLADLLGRKKIKAVCVTTAGSPMYGGVFWWLLHGRKLDHTRVEVAGDPVPYLPFFLLNYVQSGKQVLVVSPDVVATPDNPFAKHMPAAYQRHFPCRL